MLIISDAIELYPNKDNYLCIDNESKVAALTWTELKDPNNDCWAVFQITEGEKLIYPVTL